MKKLLLLMWVVVYLFPEGSPMFEGMIMRCPEGKCRWECEFGVKTGTVTVKGNLIEQTIGCKDEEIDNIFLWSSEHRIQGQDNHFFDPVTYTPLKIRARE